MRVKYPTIQATLYLFATLLLISTCKNPAKRDKKDKQEINIDTEWISLFDGKSLKKWEITNFGTQGPVRISDGNIILGMGDGCTGVTWAEEFPRMDYEVSLEAKKISGNDFFCGMTFPVGDTFCSLIVGGWGGPVVGLSTIDGLDASENETRTLKKFDHDRWYKIHLKVTQTKIEAWIDEDKIVDFKTEGRDIYIRPEVTLSKPFGICSWITTSALKNIKLKKIK